MTRPSPALVGAIWKQMGQVHSRNTVAYQRYLEAARNQLPHHADAPQFTYLVRKIWMSHELDAQAYWEHFISPTLSSEYERIDSSVEWIPEALPKSGWVSAELVKRTLSLWQERIPFNLTPDHALRMIRNAGQLADFGVQA